MSAACGSTVGADTIRRTCDVGLNIFALCPFTRAEVLELNDKLRGYIELLLPDVRAAAPRTHGIYGEAAVHVLARGREVLAELDKQNRPPLDKGLLDGRPTIRDRDAVLDLAVLCRSYLSVVTWSGPLGKVGERGRFT
jgi:hypothetical protein